MKPYAFLGDDVARPGDERRVDLLSVLRLCDEVLGGVVADGLPAARRVADDEALVRGGLPDGGHEHMTFAKFSEFWTPPTLDCICY